jgi:hypothetical protein
VAGIVPKVAANGYAAGLDGVHVLAMTAYGILQYPAVSLDKTHNFSHLFHNRRPPVAQVFRVKREKPPREAALIPI